MSHQPVISPWLTPIAYTLCCKAALPLYFNQLTVRGQQNIPKEGAIVFAPTHRARWDALIVPYAVGRRATGRDPRFMVTASEMTGVQGWLIRRLGGFPVNPERPAIASLRLGVEILQRSESLVIFPEGGIFRDRQVHSLKPGLARLALQVASSHAPVSIVPINIQYSQPNAPFGCSVSVEIGKPLEAGHYLEPSLKEAATTLTADLWSALNDLQTATSHPD